MTRITPRTCLWPITFTLLGTFALSIGLTFRSDHHCYAGTCGESLFPLQARLHVVIWYLWVSISVLVLGFRAFHPELRRILRRPLFERKIPFLGKHLAVSGVLIILWILALYGTVLGVWWPRLSDYFETRGCDNGVCRGNLQLAAIAQTGHLADITMGMVLLPISRHSALASFFKLSVSTTLAFHIVLAYTLFILVLIHAFLYISWVPIWLSLTEQLKRVYPVLNPTYLYNEAWPGNTTSLGIWRASLVFTGSFTVIVMLLVFLTTFPEVRKRHFNLFYFTHLLIIPGVIVICLHASTMFYCTSPGLVLWVVDWGMRLYELRKIVAGTVTHLGKGYYILTMEMPRNRLDGCACTSPLAHFYIYHSESSIRELHPFTTITHLASENKITPEDEDDITIQFLFRKRTKAIDQSTVAVVDKSGVFAAVRTLLNPKKETKIQWTEKLAGLSDVPATASNTVSNTNTNSPPSYSDPKLEKARAASSSTLTPDHAYPLIDVSLRLEGPYFTPADPLHYKTVIALVAGTGISGGIAIANAFLEVERQRAGISSCNISGGACMTAAGDRAVWDQCVIVWTVREEDYIDSLPLKGTANSALQIRTHLTGKGRTRLDFSETIETVKKEHPGPTWVYLSGPNVFITAGEAACKAASVDWYGARWDA